MTRKEPAAVKPYAIFDMDGTLIDSMPYWEKLGWEFLNKQGITGDLTDTLAEIETMTLSESADLFVRRFHLDMTAEDASCRIIIYMISRLNRGFTICSIK